MYSATYSPEDNKLRLYASSRLDAETYARVKAAGFKWAPKQELFVTPMWTPDREDLLLELCEEIGDEDTSLVDRAEERADRFESYSDSRRQDAESAHKAVSAIADNIPLGQPILVGHHSEKRARKDAQKIENGMRKAVRMWEQSKYWQSRAAGAIRLAKYKERPDVRARRIKGLEADKRRKEKTKSRAEICLKFWSRPDLTHAQALAFAGGTEGGWLQLPRKEGDSPDACGGQTAYGALCNDNPSLYTPRTLEEIVDAAKLAYPQTIEWCNRWLTHFDNRLSYERAMLEEAGGTVADKRIPEKGGACKCWASRRGAWSYIVKVNKVSVSVLDNWGNGGQNFSRTIEFHKLTAVLSKAEVDQAREAGKIRETDDKTGFHLLESREQWETREENKPAAVPPADPLKANIEAVKDSLHEGVKVVSTPQLFPTPAEIASQMVDAAEIPAGARVLEPSVGTCAILAAFPGVLPFPAENRQTWCGEVVAVEINQTLAEAAARSGLASRVICSDFLQCSVDELGLFDRVVMNPPFEKGADIQHIQHALAFLKPGGTLVALCANGPRQQTALSSLGTWQELPAGSFKAQGTQVNVALLVVQPEEPETSQPHRSQMALAF
jgi:hypothetical protein